MQQGAKYRLALREQKVMPFGDENDQRNNNFISAVETNIQPHHRAFDELLPQGDPLKASDRWAWIT